MKWFFYFNTYISHYLKTLTMTKLITVFILLTTVLLNSSAQSFEGIVVYQNSFKSKLPNVPDQQFAAMLGTTLEYSIKGGNYRTTTNGNFIFWQVYINTDNKLYSKVATSEAILWNDGAIINDEILKSEVNKAVVDILGYSCDELILTCKSGVQKYYYSTKLKVDASLFEKHKYQNWNEVMAKTNSVPLKMIVDNDQFTLESVATEVKPVKLDDKLFTLPADSKLEKSPF
ncbi:MAG TPA: DUF4412 domain-containing protein [Ohtaekwangia sp.]